MKNSLRTKKEMDIELINKMAKANKEWGWKFWITWFVFVVVFFLCLVFEEPFNHIGNWISGYIPMVDKLIKQPTAIGRFTADYFAALSFLIPLFSLWIIWGEDVVTRCRYGNNRLGRGKIETFVFIYLLSVPALISIIYMAYAAPFDFSGQPTNFGERLFHLMLNEKLGLLIIGSFAGVIISQIVVFLLWLFLLPIQYFFFNSQKG